MKRGRPHSREAGQSLVELAIALPILLAVVVGIFEFGRAWNVRQVLTAAAREGARLAVIPDATQPEVEAEIDERLTAAGLESGDVTTSIEGMDDGLGEPTTVTLTTEYTFEFLGPVVSLIGGDGTTGGTVTLAGISVMRNE